MQWYVDVILPLPLAGSFTYRLNEELAPAVETGSRVVVQFGIKRHYTAIVVRKHTDTPQGDYEIKSVTEVLDTTPIVQPAQLSLWQWMADYYMCSIGEVYKAAFPTGLKVESRTAVKPKKEIHVRLGEAYRSEEGLNNALLTLKRAAKQQQLLLKLIELAGCKAPDFASNCEVSRNALLEASGASPAVLAGLIDKRVVKLYEVKVEPAHDAVIEETTTLSSLNTHQQTAFDNINKVWQTRNVCLLHGVTSSGKTEVYIHLINEQLLQGKQVLYLLPEIALTQQMTDRLRRAFGAKLGVYHSKFSDAERAEVWRRQLTDKPYEIILGVRSSVFLPFKDLGLVIVDEEHEATYKQQDPAPRYHARSVAVMLASHYGGKVLLGTATPSIESYYNAQCGKYGLVQLTERYNQVQLPRIEVVDIKDEYRRKRMYGPFSTALHDAMQDALSHGKQIILFQNRRGYAPMLECEACGWVPKCDRCDVSLTYHQQQQRLVCHYCGNVYSIPSKCPSCGTQALSKRGMGTERIEEEVHRYFPTARVARMDLDSTRTKNAGEQLISDFQEGRTDVLIGTQMVSKGLDFDNVHVVGIINADTMLNYPDFRSFERSFQLMAQVAGRAGRRGQQGLVILQTKNADFPIIRQVVNNDYPALYADQTAEREYFHYPPYFRLIYIYIKGRDERNVIHTAEVIGEHLHHYFADRVLGPEAPAVARVQGLHIRKLMLKAEPSLGVARVRQCLHTIEQYAADKGLLSGVTVYYDVDPM